MDDSQENTSNTEPSVPAVTPASTEAPVADRNTVNEMDAVQENASNTPPQEAPAPTPVSTEAPVADTNATNEMGDIQENTSNTAPYAPPTPTSPPETVSEPIVKKEVHFTGFWKRVAISSSEALVSSLLGLFLAPTAAIIPVVINIILYFAKGRTIGDFIMQTKLVDAVSHEKPSTGQLIGRFFAKILSFIPFSLGFLWAGWTKEKKAWHDSLSGTRYIETKSYNGGITWVANILLLIVIPYFQMQPIISFVMKTIIPIGQGIYNGDPEQELEGIHSFEDVLENVVKEQLQQNILLPVISDPLEEGIEPLEEPPVEKIEVVAKGTPRISLTKTKEVLPLEDEQGTPPADVIAEEPQHIGMSRYATTTNAVFYDDKKLELADPATFSIFTREEDPYSLFGKDANHVYLESALIQNADPDTFEIVGNVFSKDKDRVFFYTRELSHVDSATFEELEDGTLQDKNNILTLTGGIKSPR